MITDACHSGTLAGNDYRGNYLVGKQLRNTLANEIRITSCGPDELAIENEGWGGGRGVFSFYLINGLIGFADKEKDGIIQLNDIRSYLDSVFKQDSLLILEQHKQTPILKGNDEFQLAKADIAQMKRIASQRLNAVVMPAPVVISQESIVTLDERADKLFSDLRSLKLDLIFDFQRLSKLPALSIADEFINRYSYILAKDTFETEDYKYIAAKERLQNVKLVHDQLKNDSDFRRAIERKLVVLIHDKGQEVLNAYLEGDVAELERRRYYNVSDNGFDSYPFMFATARKLLSPDDFLYEILEVNEYYFGGLSLLTKIPLTQKPDFLMQKALELEMKALELETSAPYIYNVLGTLFFYKKEYPKAEINYLKATELAPQWAIPWSNLQGLYTITRQFNKADTAYAKAKFLKADLSDVYVNNGVLQEQRNLFLFAEEQYRQGIFYNSRHYFPFERLAIVYNRTGDYALADSFYYEADIRKRGYHFESLPPVQVVSPLPRVVTDPVKCTFDSSNVSNDDVYAYFLWGLFHFKMQDFAAAEEKWKHVIQLDKKNPLAFHYLGVMYWQQKRFMELDIILQFAVRNYLTEEPFTKYVDSVRKLSPKTTYSDCDFISFEAAVYKQEEDHFYLANAYEEWNHFEEAEVQYRILINRKPSFIGSYVLLWRMLERIGRYNDAEVLIQSYMPFNTEQTTNELAAFYKRVTNIFPQNGEWNLRAGDFFYSLAKQDTAAYVFDRKKIFPDDIEPINTISWSKRPRYLPKHETIPGTNQKVILASTVTQPLTNGIEFLLLADSLLGYDNTLSAAINDKIADLYNWQGVPLFASVYYQKSIDLFPKNSGVRLKLIDACNTVYKFTSALEHLDTLKNRNEINFEKQLLLSKYYMLNSRFQEAEQLLVQAKAAHPYRIPDLLFLFGRLYLLSNQPEKAITCFEDYLKVRPGDGLVMYSISRMYALKNNKNRALDWLQKAMRNGFNYEWVLKNDPLMNQLRITSRWNDLMKGQQFKTYPPPVNSYPRATP